MDDLSSLWDFDDPAGSEHRFRVRAEVAQTQVAREVQRALQADLDLAGEHDPYVDEELALLER